MHLRFHPTPVLRTLTVSLAAATPTFAGGETITVTTVDDVVDAASASLGDLPGPDGKVSFREALAVANQEPGPQTVEFAIAPDEWWLFDDQALLRLEDGAFFVSGDETTIDFSSQTTAIGDTNPNGGEVGIYGLQANGWGIAAMFVTADDCVIRGLDRVLQRGYGVEISGDRNRVVGCTISGSLYAGVMVEGQVGAPATGNIIGGTGPGEGNVLSGGNAGVRIDGPTNGTIVIGNTLVGSSYAGVQVRGAYCCPGYTPHNTRIGGPTAAEGNWIADNGSFGEEGFPLGDQVQVEWAVNTIVEGNTIGTTEAGDARFPGASGTVGVGIRESESTLVRGNLISGIRKEGVNHYAGDVFGTAITVYGPNTGVELVDNRIGTDAAGVSPIPNLDGISFGWFQGYPAGAQIGGTEAGAPNTVAFQERHGIVVASGIEGVTIRANSIHDNGTLGIDLLASNGAAGVSPNDPGDSDGGANGLQNFPTLTAVVAAGASINVEGDLDSAPLRDYAVDVYASGACDPSGNGEGERYLGTVTVTTDGSGQASFDVSFAEVVLPGESVSATATDLATGNTSEFAACVTATVAGPFVDMGFGLAGVVGTPTLTGQGALAPGAPTTFSLADAAPRSATILVVGLQAVYLPVSSGTLVPSPEVVIPLLTDAGGECSFTAPWPAALSSGATLYAQQWIVDASVAGGLSASNAVGVMVP